MTRQNPWVFHQYVPVDDDATKFSFYDLTQPFPRPPESTQHSLTTSNSSDDPSQNREQPAEIPINSEADLASSLFSQGSRSPVSLESNFFLTSDDLIAFQSKTKLHSFKQKDSALQQHTAESELNSWFPQPHRRKGFEGQLSDPSRNPDFQASTLFAPASSSFVSTMFRLDGNQAMPRFGADDTEPPLNPNRSATSSILDDVFHEN